MRRPGRRTGIAGAILLALAGCSAPTTGKPAGGGASPLGAAVAAGEVQPLGVNRIGEPCRLTFGSRDAGTPDEAAAFDAFCGKWEAPSGRIFRVEGGNGDPMALASRGWWRSRLEQATDCRDPAPTTILGDVPAVVMDCALRPGGWPYRAVAANVDGQVFLGDAIPASEPAVQRGIGLLAGREKPATSAAAGQPSTPEATKAASPAGDGLYSAGDLLAYRRLLRLAQNANFLGNHAEAERRYREALAMQQRLLRGDKSGLAFVLMHLALELSNQKRFSEADVLFNSAGELLSASTDATDEARWTSYRAMHFANQRRFEPALEWARRASGLRLDLARASRPDLFRKFSGEAEAGQFAIGDRTGRVGELVIGGEAETALGDVAQSRYLEAAMLVRLDRRQEAEAALQDAERVLRADPRAPRRWLPQIQLLHAEILERAGDLPQAERMLRASIEAQRAVQPGARTEGRAQMALGRVLAARNRPADAIVEFEKGFTIFREQGGGVPVDEAMPYFRTALAELQRAPEQRVARGRALFAAAQIVRGTVTGQTIALAAARLAGSEGEGGSLIRELQDTRRRRDQLIQTLAEVQASPTALPPEITAVEEQLRAANARVGNLERGVQAAVPRYNQLVDTPIDVDQALAALRPNEALVQILIGDRGAVGLLIDKDGIEAYEIPLNAERAREMVARLRRPFDSTIGAPFDVATAHGLYGILFGGTASRLTRAQHLTVVPSGALLSLPMAVLVSEPPPAVTDGDYSRVAWMVRRHALSIAPSVQSFVQLRAQARSSKAHRPFLGFGDFVPSRDPDAILANLGLPSGCRGEIVAVANLARLPGTATEVRTVAATLGAPADAVVLGSDFSEPAIKRKDLSDYRVIYLATHGLLPQQLDCWAEPSLVVSKPAGVKDAGDGLLVASEIAELKLDADLVVLSACNTAGPGGESGGESLSGLARAFFYAGARTLLVTHWQIPDEPTVRLMVGLFRNIADRDLTIDEALRQSQIAVADTPKLSHPLNWGAFTVVGDGNRALDIRTPVAELPAFAQR